MKILILLIFLINFSTINSFSQWFELNSGTTSNLTSLCFTDIETGYVCGYNGTLLKTTNGGINWIHSAIDTNYSLFFINMRNSYNGFCIGGYNGNRDKLLYTTNSGENWLVKMNIPSEYQPYNILFINNLTGFISGAGIPYKTTDGGSSWQVFLPQTANHRNILLSSSKVNENIIFWVGTKFHPPANNDAVVYYTTNAGVSFIETKLPSTQLQDISFFNDQTGYIVGLGYLGSTTDGGSSWNYINSPPLYGSSVCYSTEQTLYKVTGYDIYHSSNGGLNWSVQHHESARILNFIKLINTNIGYCIGDDGIILKTTNGGIIGINNISTEIPNQFSLSQNYPNPFNPTTNFELRIADFGFVNLTIYDAMGRAVETLHNGELKPGVYKAVWNASGYPSGVYFYKLSTGSFTETRKMILIK